MFFFAGDLLDGVAAFAGGFVDLDAGCMRGMIYYRNGSSTAGLCANQMLMLKGLDKSPMHLAFVL